MPHSRRKAVFTMRFLAVDVPFHSKSLEFCINDIVEEIGELWTSDDLEVSVFHTETGGDLRLQEGSLTRSLCEQILSRPVHWTKVLGRMEDRMTHLVDFGPGRLGGIGMMTSRTIDVTTVISGTSYALYDTAESLPKPDWNPKLVLNRAGEIKMETSLTRLTGKPPLWCCGMTPSTVSGDFVAAVTNEGYSIELAGGGHYNEKMLREKVEYIKSLIKPGNGTSNR